jgi:hypothetical protein
VTVWAVLLPAQKEYTTVVMPSASPTVMSRDVERDRHDPRVGAPVQEGAPAESDGVASVLPQQLPNDGDEDLVGSRSRLRP